MKKLKLISIAFVLVLSFISTNTKARQPRVETGSWVDVYDGGSSAQTQKCASHWWYSSCIVGDTRSK